MDSLKFCGPAFIMVMIAIKTTFITDVNPLTIKGRLTNYTWILERIYLMGVVNQTTYLNRIPGIDKYEHNYTSVRSRKHNDNNGDDVVNGDNIYIVLNDEAENSQGEELNIDDIRVFDIQDGQLKEVKKETSDYSTVSISDETVDKHDLDKRLKQLIFKYEVPHRDQSQTYNKPLLNKHVGKFKVDEKRGGSKIDPSFLFENNEENAKQHVIDSNRELAQRRDGDPKAKEKITALLHQQQKRKRELINYFLKDNFVSTNYMFKEMKRILKDRLVQDDLRLMVEHLDKENNEKVRSTVSKYYANLLKRRKQYLYNKDFWKQPVNNLVINTIRDPYNYGE